jgi:anoctamin-10
MNAGKQDKLALLKFDDKEFHWKQSEFLLTTLETEGVVKLIFPLHHTLKTVIILYVG